MRRRTFLAGLGFAALQLAGCGAKPQTTPDYVLTYADNQPAGYPTTQGAQYFADLVQQQTGGKVVIQVKANGEYGSEQQVWEQLAIGGVDFARVSLSAATDDLPRLNVLLLPYLYRNADHMWRVLDGSIGAEFLQDFTAHGRVGLSWYDAGARSFYAKQPIRSLNDLAGTTVRVQDSQIVLDMMKLLGSQPVTFAYSDVYSAFQTGKIDAAENNWPAYYRMDHYKVAPYYTVDEHSRVPEVQLASGRTWAQLPEEYQSILRQCARESAQYERQLWTEEEARARQSVLAAGCREITLSEEELEAFRTLVQPLYARYCGEELELVEAIQQA
jgi:tripartite ATP-independent transporter DctP family solute receptor